MLLHQKKLHSNVMVYNRKAISKEKKKKTTFSVEKHSSTLAWKIPWIEEPGRLQSMGSLRVSDMTE